jgi:hypothetical protein
MEQLFLNGYYHGNFSLENTYCFLECSTPVVKLTNFRKKVPEQAMTWGVEEVRSDRYLSISCIECEICSFVACSLDQVVGSSLFCV